MALLLDSLLKKQKCLVDLIRTLKPQYDCTEEQADLSYYVVSKYYKWFCTNKSDIEELSNSTGIEVDIDEYWREEKFLRELKIMYSEYLLSLPLIHLRPRNEVKKAEMDKQSYIMRTVAALEPATAINQEQIDLHNDMLQFLCVKFNQNQSKLWMLLEVEEREMQKNVPDVFAEIVNRQRSILSGNFIQLRNIERLCA